MIKFCLQCEKEFTRLKCKKTNWDRFHDMLIVPKRDHLFWSAEVIENEAELLTQSAKSALAKSTILVSRNPKLPLWMNNDLLNEKRRVVNLERQWWSRKDEQSRANFVDAQKKIQANDQEGQSRLMEGFL